MGSCSPREPAQGYQKIFLSGAGGAARVSGLEVSLKLWEFPGEDLRFLLFCLGATPGRDSRMGEIGGRDGRVSPRRD